MVGVCVPTVSPCKQSRVWDLSKDSIFGRRFLKAPKAMGKVMWGCGVEEENGDRLHHRLLGLEATENHAEHVPDSSHGGGDKKAGELTNT